MPRHPFRAPRGRLEEIEVASERLAGNLLGDPSRRRVAVYLPEGYDGTDRDYPLFVSLAAFTGSGLKQLAWRSFDESLPQRVDRLVRDGAMGPAVFAFPDAFTSLGGNQYVDTPVMGDWATFLVEDLVPALEAAFRVRRRPSSRAVFGYSSGGYGALVQGMRYGDRWGAVACHSGDVGFDWCYRADLPKALTALAAHDGDVVRFLASLDDARGRIPAGDFHALMSLAMAASYDPAPDAPHGIRLPVDPRTCALDEAAWERWLRHDPLTLVESEACRESLKRLRALWIDCGDRDEYHLQYGARALSDRLNAHVVAHRFEEYPGGHSGVDSRFDRSLAHLFEALE